MKNGVFWDVTPCGSCKDRRFGGTWRLLHQQEQHKLQLATDVRCEEIIPRSIASCYLQLVLFLVHRFLPPWWRRRQFPPKRRFLQEQHGVTSQKTPFLIHIICSSIQHVLYLLRFLCLLQSFSGNGSQRRRFLNNCVHGFMPPLTVPSHCSFRTELTAFQLSHSQHKIYSTYSLGSGRTYNVSCKGFVVASRSCRSDRADDISSLLLFT
jgi:hypothetical protein